MGTQFTREGGAGARGPPKWKQCGRDVSKKLEAARRRGGECKISAEHVVDIGRELPQGARVWSG